MSYKLDVFQVENKEDDYGKIISSSLNWWGGKTYTSKQKALTYAKDVVKRYLTYDQQIEVKIGGIHEDKLLRVCCVKNHIKYYKEKLGNPQETEEDKETTKEMEQLEGQESTKENEEVKEASPKQEKLVKAKKEKKINLKKLSFKTGIGYMTLYQRRKKLLSEGKEITVESLTATPSRKRIN